jgi:tetratricopeptide (TPR) repeat protein
VSLRLLLLCLALEALSAQLVAQDMARRPFEARGLAAFTSGDNRTCADVFSRAGAEHLREPSPEFMAARCYSRLGDSQRAAHHLARALDRGFRNCAALKSEPALAAFIPLHERCERNVDAFLRSSNPELLAAYLGDRGDRSAPIEDVEAVKRRDEMRRNVVHIALSRGLVRTADDYLHAALVMQHGDTDEDFALARELARKAVELRPWLAEARYLYAAATDRHLHAIGKPQIFGTQYRQVDGKWTLEPFAPTAITDDERARWRAHSVAERMRFIDRLNEQSQQ